MKRRAEALVAVSALALVVAVVLFDWLLDGSRKMPGGYEGGDLRAYFVPGFAYVRATLAGGELPLWNPYAMAGSPFLASHTPGVLYPLWWPFFLASPSLGISGFVLLHLWLAGLFTWLYVLRLGVSPLAALAAALAYMLSYWVMSGPFTPAYGAVFAWVPAVFWALHRLLSSPGPRNAGLLAAAIALAFLAGYAQAFFYLAQFAAGYALFGLISRGPAKRLSRVGWTAVAGAVGAALCAAQLLPTWELAQQGTRSLEGLSLVDAATGGHPASELWTNAWGGHGPPGLPWLTLPLGVAALLGKRRRAHALFFALSLLVLAEFMRGTHGVLFPFYFELPGGNVFRGPFRASFAYGFAAAVLIGLGTQRIEDGLGRHLPRAALVSLMIAAGIGAGRYAAYQAKYSFLPLTEPEQLEGPAQLVEFGRRLGPAERIFIELYPNGAIPYRLGQMHGFRMVPDYEPLLPGLYRDVFAIEKIWHGILTVFPRPVFAGFIVEPELLDWFGVTYYADSGFIPEPRPPEPLQRIIGGRIVEDGPIPIIERRSALPRAYVAQRLEVLPDEESVLERMRSGPARREAFVTSAGLARAGLTTPPALGRSRGNVTIAEEGANHVVLRTRCATDCFVVLSDLDYPGWQAFVAGEEVAVVRTNYLFRGVLVPAGSERLEFVYRPTSFAVGAGASLAGTAALLLLLWAPGRLRAHDAPPAAAHQAAPPGP
jgi:hypothetical protein